MAVSALAVVLLGCGGGGSSPAAPVVPPPVTTPAPPPAPVMPVVTAPTRLKVGALGTASIPTQAGMTLAWTITGGEIVSGAGTTAVTFRSTAPGAVTLAATATNSAGVASAPGTAIVKAFTTLTTLVSSDVAGSPARGVTEFETPQAIPFAYTPAAGGGSVTVEVDGTPGAATGQVTMERDRTLWVYAQPAAGTVVNDAIVVPNDPTMIPGMDFYAARPSITARVADAYCGVKSATVAYPKRYLGAFPLPTPSAGSLPAGAGRGVALKDYWAFVTNNPTTNDGCSSDWHAAVLESLRRVKQLGADYVAIYQNGYLKDANAATLQFDCMGDARCPSWAQIPDAEIVWAADAARSLGLKLYLYVQVDVHDIKNAPLPANPSTDWLNRYFDAYKEYLLHLGAVAERAGIPVMQVDWGVWWLDWTRPELKPIYQRRMTEVASAVRGVYSGKRALGILSPWASDDPALMAQIDLLLIELWQVRFKITAQDNAELTPALVRDRTEAIVRDYAALLGKYGKPAIFHIMAQSHRDYLLNGWIEDGFCTSGCMQRGVPIDFSVQAIAYEGQLQAIARQTSFPVGGVSAVGYWFADVILPKESFPNLSQSIRGKPAEVILQRWYAR